MNNNNNYKYDAIIDCDGEVVAYDNEIVGDVDDYRTTGRELEAGRQLWLLGAELDLLLQRWVVVVVIVTVVMGTVVVAYLILVTDTTDGVCVKIFCPV